MATIGIPVFASAKEVLFEVPIQFESMTVDGTSRQSGEISGSRQEIRHCRIFSDTDCFILWGTDPTAVDFSDSLPIGAENPEVIGVRAGDKIAVIQRV